MDSFARFLLVSLFVLSNSLYGLNAIQKIKFVEDLCFVKKSVTIDLRYENTGILMSVPRHTRSNSLDCRIRLLAHKGSSVVLSIYRYDIGSKELLTIQDSDDHTVALIGSALFKDEKKSIISPGEMVITYKRNNSLEKREFTTGFQFTYTQVHESPCMDNEFACKNGKCILKELACNGNNHCGDNSDNINCVPEEISSDYYPKSLKSSSYSFVWVVVLAAVALILLIATLSLLAVLIHNSRKLKSSTTTDNPTPLQSVSSSVPVNQAQPSTVEQQRSSNTQPTETLYNRVRRSLRRNNVPRVEEVPTHRERYEVPSMYPNLDQLPTAPDIGGVDNQGYNREE